MTTRKATPRPTAFARWLDRLVDEKGIDVEATVDVEGPSGLNVIPIAIVLDTIKSAPKHEQAGIKRMIVKIDFVAPGPKPIVDYLRHLARAIAL